VKLEVHARGTKSTAGPSRIKVRITPINPKEEKEVIMFRTKVANKGTVVL